MTREEAIEYITSVREFYRTMEKFAETKDEAKFGIALDIAIEALSAEPNCEKCAIKELWEETEKEDLVAVVRCKDCRWYENRYGEVCHNPRYGDGHANYSPPYVDEEYWCKDGKRREE